MTIASSTAESAARFTAYLTQILADFRRVSCKARAMATIEVKVPDIGDSPMSR